MPRKPQRTRIFVGCEGASERAYIRWVKRSQTNYDCTSILTPRLLEAVILWQLWRKV
jgi:hypothetical protein